MYAKLGWVLLAGLLPAHSTTIDGAAVSARIAVWTDREDPYGRGEGARVYLDLAEPGHVAIFRVDTDGRLRVLFPRDPWGETRIHDPRELESSRHWGGLGFRVDDDPGIGYLFAVSSVGPLDFDPIVRGDRWDYRAIEGGRILGDPYVALADLAARIAPDGDYDYDVSPYYVEGRYDYPRFVCYDCHAYASYDEWDPYDSACQRFRVVIYDDPRYYPYRSGRGRDVVVERPRHPEPRYVFRDADPDREYVTRVTPGGADGYRQRRPTGRTSRDVGGQGSVPVPGLSSRRPGSRVTPPARSAPSRPPRDEPVGEDVRRRRRLDTDSQPAPRPVRPSEPEPRSTGEPELRRRNP